MSSSYIYRQGFTLLELMIVLIIITLAVAMVIPRIGAGGKRFRERRFLHQFILTLKRGRLKAVYEGRIITFRISRNMRAYRLDHGPWIHIPKDVAIFSRGLEIDPDTGDYLIIFYSDGSQSEAEIQIVFDQKKTYYVALHPFLGTLRCFEE